MKLSAKPISSPGRTDKFPPPLMRFLKSNAGSKSRRSKSSPMFVPKKNNSAVETQEPSSPKVTCMGQVRVKRSAKQAVTKRDRAPTRCRCWWIRKPSPCRCQPIWPNWPIFRVGSFRRKPTKPKQGSVKSESDFHGRSNDESESEDEESVNADNNAFVSNTPPKNALLLTRCRSAPYRSSSLASTFCSSPEETENSNANAKSISADAVTDISGSPSISDQEGATVPETELNLGFCEKLEDVKGRVTSLAKSENVEEESLKEECEVRPIFLTRCKSEPARTGHRLDPEVNSLWKRKRSGFVVSD